jgi:ABC-type uncharacterized transport system involved in gliding motility auxiliary subunit
MVLVEPELKESFPNVAALLKEWNLEIAADVVVDVSGMGQLFGTGPITPIVSQYPYHEITKDFRVMTAFHTARSLEAGKGTVEGVTAQNLLETSPASWAESDLTLTGEMNEGKDRKGPIALGAVATVRASPAPAPSPSPSAAAGETPEKKAEGRVAAFGDADFASNQLLAFQGKPGLRAQYRGLAGRGRRPHLDRPREPEDQRLFLTEAQQSFVMMLAVFLLPGLFVVLGIAAWWRRR